MMSDPTWRKSSFSDNGDCVELSQLSPGVVGIRDSKLGDDSPIIKVSSDLLADMLVDMKSRNIDNLL